MADRLEVRLHGEQIGWIARGSRRERIEFEWADGYTPGPVTLTESFGSVLLKAPSPAASSFFGGYALEGRQRERLTQRRGISNPVDLYAMLREFGSSIAGAVTVSAPDAASQTQPMYEPISDGEIIKRLHPHNELLRRETLRFGVPLTALSQVPVNHPAADNGFH